MNYKIEIKNKTNEEWNIALKKSKKTTLYQTKQWGDYLMDYLKVEPFFMTIKEDKKLVAQLLFFKASYFYDFNLSGIYKVISPFKNLFKVLTWAQGPIIYDRENYVDILKSILGKIEEFAKKNQIFMIKNSYLPIIPTNKDPMLDIFKSRGYTTKLWATFAIDLTRDLDEIWANIKKEARKNVKRTIKYGVIVKRTKNLEDAYEYCKIMMEHKQRMGVKRNMDKCLDWIKKQLKYLNDNFNLFIAYYKNIPISGLITWDFNGIINEVGVAHSNFALKNKIYAQDLIKWEIIKWGHETGKRIYDLTGVNPNPQTDKEKGIYRFKSKWGGELVRYNIYSKYYPSKRLTLLLKLLKRIKSFS